MERVCKDCNKFNRETGKKFSECTAMVKEWDSIVRRNTNSKYSNEIKEYAKVKESDACWYAPNKFIPLNEPCKDGSE